MTAFLTPLELAEYLMGTQDESDLSAEWITQATALIADVSAEVEAAAGFPIDTAAETSTGTVDLPGVWGRDLELPHGPVAEVTAVAVNGVALDTAAWWWNGRALLRAGTAPGFGDDDTDDLDETGGATGRSTASWGGPANTISVTYSWISATVPAIVKALTRRVCARALGNPTQITQETLGPYSVSYGSSGAAGREGSIVTEAERRRLRKALGSAGSGTIVPTPR